MISKNVIVAGCVMVIALTAQTSLADCSAGAANDDQAMAIRSFGDHFEDPIEIAYGESFLIDCDAHLISVEATIELTQVQVDGRPTAVMGDLVQCTIYDGAHVEIMSKQLMIPTEDVVQKLTFQFSDLQFKLAAGLYYFMLTTPEDCWAYLKMGTEYADGEATLMMMDGWGPQSGDTMFNIQWDSTSDYVAVEDRPWGALKALYR